MLQIVPKLSSIGILYKWFCFQRDFLVQSVEGHSMVVGLLSLLIESELKRRSREGAEWHLFFFYKQARWDSD